MKINQENYEQYFLDHLEGALSPEMEKELMLFLEARPDLKAMLASLDDLPQVPKPESAGKELRHRLKRMPVATKRIDGDNIDKWLVKELENLLDPGEELELGEFLALNPAYQYDREKFRHTKLHPDLSIRFNRKEKIKKRPVILYLRRAGWVATAVAAALLLFFGIRFLFEAGDNKGTPSQIAGTPSLVKQDVTHSQSDSYQASTGTPSQNPGTPSQETVSQSDFQDPDHGTPSLVIGTPSRVGRMKTYAATSLSPETHIRAITLKKNNSLANSAFEFPEEKEKSLLAKVFANFTRRTKDGLKNQIRIEENNVPDFSFWTIARAGIQGYNNIADREVELYVHRDADGRVSSYALVEHNQLLVEKNLGKN
jgi:hypothetical protein